MRGGDNGNLPESLVFVPQPARLWLCHILFSTLNFSVPITNCDIDKLTVLATTFRTAIVKCDPKSLIITLHNFPRGACGDASLLLAKYLRENGCGEFQYVVGGRCGHSHAWLLKGDIIVDLTADQFKDQPEAVLVTRDHGWHNTFEFTEQREANYERYVNSTPHIYASLEASYKAIISRVDNLTNFCL